MAKLRIERAKLLGYENHAAFELEDQTARSHDFVSVEKYVGETISIVQVYRDYYDKNKSEETLRCHLNAPVAIRLRNVLQKELEKLTKTED